MDSAVCRSTGDYRYCHYGLPHRARGTADYRGHDAMVSKADVKLRARQLKQYREMSSHIRQLSQLLKTSTDVAQIEDNLDELRESVALLSSGGMGSTLHDVKQFIKACDRIQVALPRFVAWNRRKQALEKHGKLSEEEAKWIQRSNDSIQSVYIAPIKGLSHYFLMRFYQVQYKDEVNIRITEAEGQAAAAQELAKAIATARQSEGGGYVPQLQDREA
jgi:hypothetical protein